MDLFSSVYNRLLVIRPKGQEILYVTRSLIAFLGASFCRTSLSLGRADALLSLR